MRNSRSKLRRRNRSTLATATLAVIGAAFATPIIVAASLVAFASVRNQNRRARVAPRPGTLHSRVEESDLSIYTDGAALYGDMIEAIESAQHSILMESFIWKNDIVGQRFIDSLNAAAKRGVEAYLIYDGFANLVIPSSFYRQLSEKIHVFRVPAIGRQFWKGPLRYTGVNHSKILVVDDAVGFVGGYNIGSVYAQSWRDTHLRLVSPDQWGLRQPITRVWNEFHGPDEQIPWTPPNARISKLRVAANLPVQLVYPIRNMYLTAFERARRHIWLATPYFIPDRQILESLVKAAERGVDVRVMVPKASNHVLGDWVSRGFFEQLLDAGASILLYETSMMHSKIATIDGEWSTVGTANIDRLSLSFNYETNVEIVDPAFAAAMEKVFRGDAEHCETLGPNWHDRHPMVRLVEAALVPLRPWL